MDRDGAYYSKWAQRLTKDTGGDPAWTAADVRDAEAMMGSSLAEIYHDRFRD